MRLHLVGGFLGSGKTTAIIGACRELVARGERVGVVTNDQGRYLVDTAFFRAASLPTVEVTGGCFCCNFADLAGSVESLERSAVVVFAESVGSCADLVATVLNPVAAGLGPRAEVMSLSVFVDARYLRERLAGRPLPFSADVRYIFDEQIEESGLLVVNKVDLLTGAERTELAERVSSRYPGKPALYQSSLDPGDLHAWLAAIEGERSRARGSLDIDYDRYGAGEAALAWYDAELAVRCAPGQGDALVDRLFRSVRDALDAERWPIGHLKFHALGASGGVKLSVTGADRGARSAGADGGGAHTGGAHESSAPLAGAEFSLVVNARVETRADALAQTIRASLERAAEGGAVLEFRSEASFHPAYPRPTHRLA